METANPTRRPAPRRRVSDTTPPPWALEVVDTMNRLDRRVLRLEVASGTAWAFLVALLGLYASGHLHF